MNTYFEMSWSLVGQGLAFIGGLALIAAVFVVIVAAVIR